MDDAVIEEIVARAERGERFAVGLMVEVQGSAPQKAGARLLVLPDGRLRGTVGGGCLEMEARRRALLALRTGEADLFELRLDDDFGWDDGLICGGKATLLITPRPERMAHALAEARAAREAGLGRSLWTRLEGPEAGSAVCRDEEVALQRPTRLSDDQGNWLVEPVRPQPTLAVLGCGHVGAALVELAASVGFDVVAVDDRLEFADAARLPSARHVVCADMVGFARDFPIPAATFWVIVTRGHRNDGRVLSQVLQRDFGYVGMIGSRRKVRIIKEGLRAEGVSQAALDRLHAPIGLPIGAQTPREIALSIVAELIAVRYGCR